ncbi:hypothetical protein [Natrarchaeobius chitinivorans]|uniref:Uncharacterized protein n=1 Tax=Natrarchaeobius chitinivorans TaxID=1679083 RepID=A0A3N6LU23_NATCH|nr:hypothetical protein [Natrarchaeobius chitinivorans]RQG92107.1 hypothetical protein EA473_17795 [Natrarchaeobius chitinivorans]
MSNTVRTLRATAASMLLEIGAAIGTFVGLSWFGANAALAVVRGVGTSPADAGVPEEAVWFGILVAASLGTIWLERSGYRTIRANPAGGGEFARLSVCYLPVTFLPAGYALSSVVGGSGLVVNLYLIACVLVGGWLSFYGGLERLDVTSAYFVRTFLLVFCSAVFLAVAGVLLPVSDVLRVFVRTPVLGGATLALFALAGQILVLFAGFGIAVRDPTPVLDCR